MKKIILLLFCLLMFFPLSASADHDTVHDLKEKALQDAKEVQCSDFDFSGATKTILSGQFAPTLQNAAEYISGLLTGELKENISLLIKIVVLGILSGVLCNLEQAPKTSGISEISFLACFSLVAGLSVSVLKTVMDTALTTIDSLMLYINTLFPVLGSFTITGTAVGFYPALFIAMQSFIYICKAIFLPLISVMTVFSVINAMSNRFHIAGLVDFLKQAVKWGLGLLLTIFVGVLGARSVTTTIARGITGRTVKYALCNFIPLVGGVLAESADAVLSGLKLVRSAMGVAGVVALVSLCAAPVCKMLAISLLYRFAAGVAEPATDKRITKLLTELAEQITLIFVLLLMACVMFIISVALLCTLQ